LAQRYARRQASGYEIGGVSRDENLTAVTGRDQTRNAIDRHAEIIAGAFVGLACRNRNPNAQLVHVGEVLAAKASLRIDRRFERLTDAPERGAKCIADRLKNVSSLPFDPGPHDLVMPSHRIAHSVGMRVPASRASLDIGE
jgi:hypothetical protein